MRKKTGICQFWCDLLSLKKSAVDMANPLYNTIKPIDPVT